MKLFQAIVLFVAPVLGDDASPIGKVFDLLENLRQRILADAEAADEAYSHYAKFCGMTSKQVTYEIDTADTQADKLKSKVSKLASDIQVGDSRVNKFSGDIAKAEAEVKEAKSIRSQEVETFKEGEKQLVSTSDTLGRALTTLERQQAKGGSFAQLDETTMTSLVQILSALDDAAAIDGESMDKLTALIQAHDDDDDGYGTSHGGNGTSHGGDGTSHGGPSYTSHGGPIMGVLEDMREKSDTQLDNLRKNEAAAKHTYELMLQGLEDEIKATSTELTQEKSSKAQATEEEASAEGNLEITVKERKVSGEKRTDLTQDCMTASTDHEANVASRQEELRVIAEAKRILKEATGSAASFLQLKAMSKVSSKFARARQLAGANLISSMQKLAEQHHSAALAQLASRVSAELKYSNSRHGADPFKKVKTLVENMIAKLEKEATEEATEKAYCDEEMAKTEAKKSELEDTVEKLSAKIEKAASQSSQLKEEVSELQNELSELAKEQAKMDKIRREEHAAHVQSVADLEKGLNGVRKALSVLRDFYGADDEASLLQADVSSDRDQMSSLMQQAVEQPEPPKQAQKSTGAGQGIIHVLEVCESDIAKNLATEDTEESDAQTSYDKESQANKIAKAQKEQDAKYKTKEFKSLDKSISELEADRGTDSEELSAVTQYFAKVKERCIAKPKSYDELVARRQAEIEGLKEALASLESQAFLQLTRRKNRLRGSDSLSPDSV